MVADLIGARKEARRRKRVWEEWAIREYGGVGIAYNNPNVTFSKVDDMFKGKKYILFCFRGRGIYENLVGTNFFKRKFVLWWPFSLEKKSQIRSEKKVLKYDWNMFQLFYQGVPPALCLLRYISRGDQIPKTKYDQIILLLL